MTKIKRSFNCVKEAKPFAILSLLPMLILTVTMFLDVGEAGREWARISGFVESVVQLAVLLSSVAWLAAAASCMRLYWGLRKPDLDSGEH